MIKKKYGLYRLGYITPIQKKYNVTLKQLNKVIEEWVRLGNESNNKIRFFDKSGNLYPWSIEENGRIVCNNPDASLCIFETPFSYKECKLYGVLRKKHRYKGDSFQWHHLTIDIIWEFLTHNDLPPNSCKKALEDISKLVGDDISFEAYNNAPRIKFFNSTGSELLPSQDKVISDNAKFAVVYTNFYTPDNKQVIGWFTKKSNQPVLYSSIIWGTNEDFKHAQDWQEMKEC